MQIKASSRKAMRKNTKVSSDRTNRILDRGNTNSRVHSDECMRKGNVLLTRTPIRKHFRKKNAIIN